MTARTVAIAQPTFLPWLGWFDLADQADVLVILDDVAFSKQSWQQRNRIRSRDGLAYLSVPVRTSGRLGQLIVDVEIVSPAFADKMMKTIAAAYSRAPFFERYYDPFNAAFRAGVSSGRLVDLNLELIDWMARELGVATQRVRSSTLGISGKRGDYVAALVEHLGGARYISPAGAEEYLLEDRGAFECRGLAVDLHVYEHPEYAQCFTPFLPYASALDLLFNEGDSAGRILRSGRRAFRPLPSADVTLNEKE